QDGPSALELTLGDRCHLFLHLGLLQGVGVEQMLDVQGRPTSAEVNLDQLAVDHVLVVDTVTVIIKTHGTGEHMVAPSDLSAQLDGAADDIGVHDLDDLAEDERANLLPAESIADTDT